MTDLRDAIGSLERRMDERFAGIDQRFASIERRMDQQSASLDQRLATLDARMATQSLWLVGLQVTTIVAVVTAVLVR
jgi:hypothetical protein